MWMSWVATPQPNELAVRFFLKIKIYKVMSIPEHIRFSFCYRALVTEITGPK